MVESTWVVTSPRVEETYNFEHSSLFQYVINYGSKTFYSIGRWSLL
jgi:hypothetical protein